MFDGSLLTFTMKLENSGGDSGGVGGGVSDEDAMIPEYCNVPRSITKVAFRHIYRLTWKSTPTEVGAFLHTNAS